MKPSSPIALRIVALLSLAFCAPSYADWVVSADSAAVRPVPELLQVQSQNPPSFTWSRSATATAATRYVLEIQRGIEPPVSYTSARNWYLPTTALAAGTYTWRVRTADSTLWSTPRSFVINASSVKFEVPDNESLRAKVLQHGRSRLLPQVFPTYSTWTAAMLAERGTSVKDLTSDVVGHMPMVPLKDSDWPLQTSTVMTSALVAQMSNIRNRVNNTGHQLEAASLLFRLTGNEVYLAEAIRRGDELAALSPTGPTSYINQSQGTRVIALSLSKAADFLWNSLDATRRAAWLASVNSRTTDIYNDLSGRNGQLDQYPYDSTASNTLGFLALISVLTLQDLPAATTWFDYSVRSYVHSVYAWSGPEGGYANGTAYAQGAVDLSLQIWDGLAQSTGVNLYQKPWSRGFAEFFIHFVPPGSKLHTFGDGHEDIPNYRFLRAYASRFSSPAAKWYYNNVVGNENPLTLLMAPSPLPVNASVVAAPPPNAALYPSIGWVAMHSNLADLGRTSLYFKSSPFGAYAHSHGDQNGFLLSSGGRQLLIETGYYDWYGSPLSADWYRQTKAHNAVTMDGGIGQRIDGNTINLTRGGRITAFSTSSTVDYAEGDAVKAYGGALTTALRKIWYLRGNNSFVVMDTLASAIAHKYEWTMHAPVPIVLNADKSLKILNVDRSVCIRPLTPNLTFATRVGAPPKVGTTEYHGAYVTPSLLKAEILMLLDVGCKMPAVSLVATPTGRTLTVGGQVITLPK